MPVMSPKPTVVASSESPVVMAAKTAHASVASTETSPESRHHIDPGPIGVGWIGSSVATVGAHHAVIPSVIGGAIYAY